MSERDMIIELLTITEVKDSGEVVFTDRSIEIIKELGERYAQTPIYKKSRAENPDWEGDANAGLLFVYMCNRIEEAPTTIHMMISTKLLLPMIWEKLQEELRADPRKAEQEAGADVAKGGLASAT